MELAAQPPLPFLPLETPECSSNPDPFLQEARLTHPWLARFSNGYVVHGYQAAADLLADSANLTTQGFGGLAEFYGLTGTMWDRFWKEGLNDDASHARLRGRMALAFTPRHARQLRPLMRKVMTDLLDEWAPAGAFDFADFVSHYPVTVICGLLGMSSEPIARLRTALEDQFAVFAMDAALGPKIMPSWDVLWHFADRLIADREAGGDFTEDSLLDTLIAARNAGQLDETELRFMLIIILEAGYDSSKNMLTLTMRTLIDRPQMYERCADDREYCNRVIDESLRHSGIAIGYRMVSQDFTYGGAQFRKGDRIVIPLSLPGRDPQMFEDPFLFDPHRANANRHIAFGRGGHICLGQFVARELLGEGLHLIAQRMKRPQLDGPVVWRPILGIWGLRSLPVRFEPA